MQQNRKRAENAPSRAAHMEQAETSRERMTNRDRGAADRGTSTDRAMYDDEAEPRPTADQPSERGSGTSGERNRSSSDGGMDNGGSGRKRSRQVQSPDRDRSQSER